jgi:histidine ammonia-lyase
VPEGRWLIDGDHLTIPQVADVAYRRVPVPDLAPDALARIAASRAVVERAVAEGQVVYGVTTGFGRFADIAIAPADRAALQRNLIQSHAAGVGPELPPPVVRAMLLLRANALAKGFSGVRAVVVQRLLELLDRDVLPVVPEQGSVGASGDLAPLAHLALLLIGLGTAHMGQERLSAAEALHRVGLQPLTLEAKEGLALINGTQMMTALGVLAADAARHLLDAADMAAALTVDVLRGIPDAYHSEVAAVRPHPGQAVVARHLREALEGSGLTTQSGALRVQDAYSLRCVPQVHGASRDAMAHVAAVLEREINSATDNPLIFSEGAQVISAGNFHGQPVALALDYAAIALAELADISERRLERLVNPMLSGLPAFLVREGGLNSGLMLAQYTAAALVSENKVLAHPASVDSIPTSANQEDHVSMGSVAAVKLARVVANVRRVLAAELLAGAQAADFVGPGRLGTGTRRVYDWVRQRVPFWDRDRMLGADLETLASALEVGPPTDVFSA